ncbi:light-sensor Protein kinase-like [Argentina anserina]|uniref:light-sensor Protein kinase-like n=1 Tax=Argentina anserina TaxID=57926 RepID=UPI00217627FE|nr:light-sensor Protein kinase-like [Potentilla anserina]
MVSDFSVKSNTARIYRLGCGSQYKEILWLGESFASRQFYGEIEPLLPEISSLLSLSHPNIVHCLCAFTDEEKKECFLIMELMNKDLGSYIKEIYGPRKRIPFTLHVAIDLMLQIARGMEYLHSKKIYHGELNPCNILVKGRGLSTEGFLIAKISGFGLTSIKNSTQKNTSNQNGSPPVIWYSPEFLEEQDCKNTVKLLTGKVPFEDSHLQGKVPSNILLSSLKVRVGGAWTVWTYGGRREGLEADGSHKTVGGWAVGAEQQTSKQQSAEGFA